MAIITLPGNLSFIQWTQQIQQDLPGVLIPLAISEEKWREWAQQLLENNQFFAVPLPSKENYPNVKDWNKWGDFFVSIVYNMI